MSDKKINQVSRRDFIKVPAAASIAALASSSSKILSAEEPDQKKEENKKHPNILFLFCDQQRPDSMGCYGSELNITPNLDALARQGVVFDNCYVQNPLCCPSRHSILTGRYPHSNGVISNCHALRPGETSFGHMLKRQGYNTAMIGKMHLTPWHDLFGFDGRIIAEAKFQVDLPDDYEKFLNIHGTSRNKLYDIYSDEFIKNCCAVKSKLPQELHIDSFVGRSTCEYLRNIEEPFCVFSSFLSPHDPYDPPKPYDELYINKKLPKKNMAKDEILNKPREAYDYINNKLPVTRKWTFTTDKLTDEQVHITKAYYYSTCTLIDDWVGRIIKVLKDKSMYDNTIIVYSSDHGDLLGDHGLVYKQCFYEQSVKAPLIFHAPKYFAAGRSKAMVESMDLFNTFCDIADAWPGYGRQGKSLLPVLKDISNRDKHREAVFSENYFGRMVRYENHKMVYYPGKPYGELYNLADDPDELINLWDKLEGSAIKRQLKDLLLDWSFTSENPLPLPVRAGHYDYSPLDQDFVHGSAVAHERQHWHFEHLGDFYKDWNFSEDGKLR